MFVAYLTIQSENSESVKLKKLRGIIFYNVDSYDLQSQYFEYVDIRDLTVEKIPHNKEAA
jgi:hypothetical protein